MKWEIEYTDEFGAWWETLTEAEQESNSRFGGSFGNHGTESSPASFRHSKWFPFQKHEGTTHTACRKTLQDSLCIRSKKSCNPADRRQQGWE